MSGKNYKILVVDDEEDILEFLSYNLKKDFLYSLPGMASQPLNRQKRILPT